MAVLHDVQRGENGVRPLKEELSENLTRQNADVEKWKTKCTERKRE